MRYFNIEDEAKDIEKKLASHHDEIAILKRRLYEIDRQLGGTKQPMQGATLSNTPKIEPSRVNERTPPRRNGLAPKISDRIKAVRLNPSRQDSQTRKECIDSPSKESIKKSLDALASVPTQLKNARPIGELCPECKSELVVKKNFKNGSEFISCSAYPACRYIKAEDGYIPSPFNTGIKCPDDGGNIMRKKSRFHRYFYACDGFPRCKRTFAYLPVQSPCCPQCGGMLMRRGIKEGTTYECSNEACAMQYDRDLRAFGTKQEKQEK